LLNGRANGVVTISGAREENESGRGGRVRFEDVPSRA
jgi:hypothetical protein